MMRITWVEAATAVYLIGGALVIEASKNFASKVVFKVVPMALGLPMALHVAGTFLGWPV